MSLFKDNNEPKAKDILYQDSIKEKQKEQERFQLMEELKDKLTPAQILYSSADDLRKIRDTKDDVNKGLTNKDDLSPAKILYGKERQKQEFKGAQTGGASGIQNNTQNHNEPLKGYIKKDVNNYDDNFILNKTINNSSSNNSKLFDEELKKAKEDKFEKNVKNMEFKIQATSLPPLGKLLRSSKGADAAGMINLSEGKNLPVYTKDAVKIKNINDEQLNKYNNGNISKHKPYIEQKIKDQFKDFGFKLEDIDGHIFKSDSAPVKRIKQSEDFKNILVKNKDAILKGKRFSGKFEKHGKWRSSNLHNAFGSADFLNSGIDKNGNLHLYMFDTYDFNKGEGAKVEAGRRQMMKGNLKGQFSLHEIVLSKDELGELWK